MRSSIVSASSLIGLSCLSLVSAAPFSYSNNPLGNDFPTLASGAKGVQELKNIELQAHGSLSNAPPPPTKPKYDSLTSLRLIAATEVFEVAFFTELLFNITNNVDGYEINHKGARDFIVRALTAVQAQEELHALNANNALVHFNEDPFLPCEYNFPVTTFEDAIALAATFTDVVLGTLQDVQTIFATDGDIGLIPGSGAVIGQEGQQSGFYRQLLDKTPSALPFLTTSTREFAFSALQGFIVPNSCPNLGAIDLQIFGPLNVDTEKLDVPEPTAVNLDFSFELKYPQPASWHSDFSGLSLVYINQQNIPVVAKLQNARLMGGVVTFNAFFPFNGTTFGNGLTIAAVTNSSGPFADAKAVASTTVYGPGLIEVN
jgi:hypothetical protein